MSVYRIVIDTNVFFASLYSQRGASYKLLSLIDSNKFQFYISTTLILEYEDIAKRKSDSIALSEKEIDNIIDYICLLGKRQEVFYLWRPFLRDIADEFVLELAVAANCDYIVTFNISDFFGVEQTFGIGVITPKKFLKRICEI